MVNHIAVAASTILTILLVVKFLVSDTENTVAKVATFILLLGIIWTVPHFYADRGSGVSNPMSVPIRNSFIQSHFYFLYFVMLVVWAIYLYSVYK